MSEVLAHESTTIRTNEETLSTQQLRVLKCEINSELDTSKKVAITDEELKLISSLFA